jgi:NADH-quinone oxidoreductase subunit C
MMLNFKLFFKYVFWKINYAFVTNLSQRSKNTNIVISNNSLFYSCTHLKMASIFYNTQLCDMLAYEVLNQGSTNINTKNKLNQKYSNWTKAQDTIVVYNFHSLMTQHRFFLFTHTNNSFVKSKFLSKNDSSDSIAELFSAANWLEREIAELHGVSFAGKKDLRNLMLQYGDTSSPFQKLFPSIGLKELFYDPLKDTLVQKNVSVQL